ncbi:MAG: asparagine synthase (glutamine-hydrolyzing), partial [Bryobacteraceae bacterium]
MCGITGAIGNFGESGAQHIVESMVSALGHRGPDDSGINSWSFDRNMVVFGQTRLAIIDVSPAGHQPMTEGSGRYWTVFNGEIYNFKELRKLLDPDKSLFHTSTDTEAILHSYHRWSEQAFRIFRGMFAFALLDKHSRVIHLVRDPFGIKPLYYYASAEKLLFASEVQALLASGQVPRRINANAVSHFLDCGWFGRSETAISEIKMLQPGHVLTIDLSRGEMKWNVSRYEPELQIAERTPGRDRNENSTHMLHLLEQSVNSHLVSDVPVGLFLSGGIDSAVILQLMRRMGRNIPKTFTVVFPEEDLSERVNARKVAQLYDAEHHELELTETSLFSQLPSALAAMDLPTMDGVNTFVISKAVRSAGIKVALSGLGADELFAGYPSFRRARLAKAAAKVPRSVRAGLANYGRRFSTNPSRQKFWDLLESDGTPRSAYDISRRLFSSDEVSDLFQNGRGTRGNGSQVPDSEYSNSADVVNDISRLELRGYMTDLLLRDTDFMSMASSLEVRVPFVDKEVIRFALQLPGSWKVSGSRPKPFLLETMQGMIPEYVWNHPKIGFVLPFERWMRSSLRAQLEDTLCSNKLAEGAGLVPKGVERVWRSFLK